MHYPLSIPACIMYTHFPLLNPLGLVGGCLAGGGCVPCTQVCGLCRVDSVSLIPAGHSPVLLASDTLCQPAARHLLLLVRPSAMSSLTSPESARPQPGHRHPWPDNNHITQLSNPAQRPAQIKRYYRLWVITEAPGVRCWPRHNAGDAYDESPEPISGSGTEGSNVRLRPRLRLR